MDTYNDTVHVAASKIGFAEVVLALVTGNDVFVVLPMGYGKRLCYACLPILFDHLLGLQQGEQSIVVVWPLMAIIEDQVLQMW